MSQERASLLKMDSDLGLLSDLEEEYNELSGSISRQISSLAESDPKKSSEIVDNIRNEMEQCKSCVHNMKGELSALSTSQKEKWRNKVERYESDFKTLKKDFEREKNSAQRKELFHGASDNINITTTDEQARLILTNKQEQDNTIILKDSARQLHDTEDQAVNTQEELYVQRNKIKKISSNLVEGNTMLGRMGRTIRRMGRREALMKVLWCFIVLLILGVIALVIYLSVRK